MNGIRYEVLSPVRPVSSLFLCGSLMLNHCELIRLINFIILVWMTINGNLMPIKAVDFHNFQEVLDPYDYQ